MSEIFKRFLGSRFLRKTIKTQCTGPKNVSKLARKSCTDNNSTDLKRNEEFKVGRRLAQNKLQEMLKIRPIEALEIVISYKKFLKTPCALINKNYRICNRHEVKMETILKYPDILTELNLSEKIQSLKKIPFGIDVSFPLLRLNMKNLYVNTKSSIALAKKIQFYCKLFDVTEAQTFDILSRKTFLLSIDESHLEENIKVLMDYGFTKSDIVNDLWILKYSQTFIESRLKLIKEHKADGSKTWMIRCPEETLFKHIKRESDNRDILGENSVAEYLSERLKCNEELAKVMIRKHPALQKKSLLKINEMIDFLYKHGFTSNQICRVPKILLHSSKTSEKRIKELKSLGVKPDSIYVLTKSQKKYVQHLENASNPKSKQKEK